MLAYDGEMFFTSRKANTFVVHVCTLLVRTSACFWGKSAMDGDKKEDSNLILTSDVHFETVQPTFLTSLCLRKREYTRIIDIFFFY